MTRTRVAPAPPAACAVAVLLLAVIAATPASAQFHVSLNHESSYNDNSFYLQDRRADVYHQSFLSLSYDIESDNAFLQPFYYGALVLFRTYDNRTYNQHRLGVWYSLQLNHRASGDEEESVDEDTGNDVVPDSTDVEHDDEGDGEPDSAGAPLAAVPQTARQSVTPAPAALETNSDSAVSYLYLIPSILGRFDRNDYLFHDFRAANINATVRFPLPGPVMARVQGEGEYRQYPHFEQFTHTEYVGTVTLNSRIVSGTTAFGAVTYGRKKYTETVYDTVFITQGHGNGKGKGGVKPPKKSISQYTTPAASQVTLSLGIVQPVGDGSVSLSWLRRTNPLNTARYLDSRAFDGVSEDDVFDDRYGYQSNEALVVFDVPLKRLRLSAQLSWQARTYPRIASALDGTNLPGDPQRTDTRIDAQFGIRVPLLHRADGSDVLGIGASYQYLRNQSNDAYHDYALNLVSLVLDVSF